MHVQTRSSQARILPPATHAFGACRCVPCKSISESLPAVRKGLVPYDAGSKRAPWRTHRQEVRLLLQDALQAEGLDPQDAGQVHVAAHRLNDLGAAVERLVYVRVSVVDEEV